MLFSVVLLLAAPAQSTDATGTSGGATQQASAKPKKVCRTTAITGSRVGKRVCKTQDEWDNDAGATVGQLQAMGAR